MRERETERSYQNRGHTVHYDSIFGIVSEREVEYTIPVTNCQWCQRLLRPNDEEVSGR